MARLRRRWKSLSVIQESRYVDTSVAEERIDIGAALARLRELEHERDLAVKKMDELLVELGYGR